MILRPAHLRLVKFASLDAKTNMDLDRSLLAACESDPGQGFLRFYTWSRPTLSMGRLEPDDAVDRRTARRDGVVIVRRPTGGRVVLHGDDLTYTVVLPKPPDGGLHKTYNLISEILVEGFSSMGAVLDIQRGKTGRSRMIQRPCFASVSRYEVTHEGKKVVGSAQRVGDRAVLQHGSIPLGKGYLRVVDYMNVAEGAKRRMREEMLAGTTCLEEVLGRSIEAKEVAGALREAFKSWVGRNLEVVAWDHFVALPRAGRQPRFEDGRRPSSSHKSP